MCQKELLDNLGTLLPIVLSVVVVIQNGIIARRNEELQKEIHNRDIANQAHEDILIVYRTYYDFCDTIFSSHLHDYVRLADVTRIQALVVNLFDLKRRIIQNLDMARMLFSKEDKETFEIIEDRFNGQIRAVDKYQDYILSGRLEKISSNAWSTILENKNLIFVDQVKYSFQELLKYPDLYDEYIELCNTDEFKDIQKTMNSVMELHSYDKYDKYFEKYLFLKKL